MRRSCCSGVASLSQAHISNFLNKKRALSLDGLDRVLAAQNLTVDQLIPLDICASDSQPPTTDPIEAIPVVSPTTAMDEPVVRPGSVIETIRRRWRSGSALLRSGRTPSRRRRWNP